MKQFWNGERLAVLRRMWLQGIKCRVIAKHFGISVGAVSNARKACGLDARAHRMDTLIRPRMDKPERRPVDLPIMDSSGIPFPTRDRLMAGR